MRVVIYHKTDFINDSFNYSSLNILASKLTHHQLQEPGETFPVLLPLPLLPVGPAAATVVVQPRWLLVMSR